jgi:excisionase family DNA binding protein
MTISFGIKEACKKTGFGRTKLYEVINSGALPAKKWGNRTIILAADLEAFLSNLENYPVKTEVRHG